METWNRRFNLGGLRFSAFDRISIQLYTILISKERGKEVNWEREGIQLIVIGIEYFPQKPNPQCPDREANEALGQIGGINHHPPLRPRASPPLNIQRKNPLVAPTSLFFPASIHSNISKISIHTNRII
ncbi:hypothetical protein N7537_004935 [Penicillium hordei]|uniref:Uncharacterized protein n=1 Tax=Penicillium hordei TaxID=40994 RepID=A0AAD6ECI0_9EURO|nr:uncharacterized protein N7537_004935 [Penicillium hordei]KAJ5608316.1 hypothetical protein N7537_004935 [Penicillium hordei]